MARIPLVTRDQVVDEEKPAYDAFMQSRAGRPNIGPYSLLAHMPEMPQRLEALRLHLPVGRLTDDWYFVCGIDVVAPQATGAIVALGDSLTDANISTHDGHHSWPSQLARRLMARQSGRPMAVMNQGLGRNRILHDIRGDSGLRRFDRDVPRNCRGEGMKERPGELFSGENAS